jgi:hypothetical protein
MKTFSKQTELSSAPTFSTLDDPLSCFLASGVGVVVFYKEIFKEAKLG